MRLVLVRGFTLFLFFAVVSSVPALGAGPTEDWVSSVRSSILALDSARTTAVQELQGSALSGEEADDYRDFIVYLNTRIVTYCRELQQQGVEEVLEELPCPDVAMLGGGAEGSTHVGEPGSPGEAQPARTRKEQTGALHSEFLEALGEFDQMLLNEEEKVAARVPSQRETGEAGSVGSGGASGSSGASGEAGEHGSGETSRGAGQQGMDGAAGESFDGDPGQQGEQTGQAGRAAQGAPGSGDGRTAAEDASRVGAQGGKLPPPEDDDIVARQLREAAEKETDPELKKKLWEEYWKYRGVVKK